MTRGKKDALEGLFTELAKALKNRLDSGAATAADMAVVRQFLKDNGITATEDNPDLSALKKKAMTLPTFDDELDGAGDFPVQ